MTLVITEPIKTVNGLLTKALAGRSQLLYKIQRVDYTVANGVQDGSQTDRLVLIVGSENKANFTPGEFIYFTSDNGLYDVYAEVYNTASGNTIGILTPYLGESLTGFIVQPGSKTNYYIAVTPYTADDVQMFRNPFKYVPNTDGSLTIDVSVILRTYQSRGADVELSQEFYLQFQEFYKEIPTPSLYTYNSLANAGNVVFDIDTSFGIDLTNIFKVGDFVDMQFESGLGYVDGRYEILTVSVPAGTRTRLGIDTPFIAVGTGIGSFVGPYLAINDTSIVQSVYARKQILLEGGANLWEYLLREEPVPEPGLKTVFPGPLEVEGTGTAWTKTDTTATVTLTNAGQAAQFLYSLPEIETEAGTIIDISYGLNVIITNFVSAGPILVRVLRKEPGSSIATEFWRETVQVTANGTIPIILFNELVPLNGDAERLYFAISRDLTGSYTAAFTLNTINILAPDIVPEYEGKGLLLTTFENPIRWRNWGRTTCLLYDREYRNRVEGGIPQPAPPFNATFTGITSGNSGSGGGPFLQNVTPTPQGELEAGDWIYITWNGGSYVDGNYQVISVLSATTLEMDIAYQEPQIPGTISPAQGDADYGIYIDTFETDINKNDLSGPVQSPNFIDDGPSVVIYGLPEPSAAAAYQRVLADASTGDRFVSEEVFYEVQGECRNPIMLDWINSLGGIEQWLFSINQRVTEEVESGQITERPIREDIEFVTRTKRRFPQENVQRIRLTAEELTFDQLKALHEIKQTESLRVYLTKDGSEYVDAVVANTFTTEYDTEYRLFDFTVEIEFPDDFDFFKGKKY